MGYFHSGDQILAAAVAAAQEVGLGDLTYRVVGERLSLPPRTVVYYFPTKKDLVVSVLGVVAEQVEGAMTRELGDGPLGVVQAFSGMWRALATDEMDPFFRLYVELVGLAAARRKPFDDLMFKIYHEWIDWLEPRMAGPTPQRRAAAVAAYGLVDGLLVARCIGARDATSEAATWAELHPALGLDRQ